MSDPKVRGGLRGGTSQRTPGKIQPSRDLRRLWAEGGALQSTYSKSEFGDERERSSCGWSRVARGQLT